MKLEKKTDKIGGYKYTTVLMDRDYEKIDIKIEGNRLIEEQEKYDIPVKFNGLEVSFIKILQLKIYI